MSLTNQINSYIQKQSVKVIPRKRIYSFNEYSQKQIREFGLQFNKELIQAIPIPEGKKKKECRKTLSIINNQLRSVDSIDSVSSSLDNSIQQEMIPESTINLPYQLCQDEYGQLYVIYSQMTQ